MKREKFLAMLNDKKYDNLERELKKEYKTTQNLEVKYQLGICYSEQVAKREDAKIIFKELMTTNFHEPYMYHFNASQSGSKIERVKIIREGIRKLPDNKMLNNYLIFYLDNEEKEKHFNEIKSKELINEHSVVEMTSYYFEKKQFSKANQLLDEKILMSEKFDTKDIKLIKILCSYLSGEIIDLDEINSFIVSDDDSILGIILRLIEIDIKYKNNVIEATRLLSQVEYRAKNFRGFIEIIHFYERESSYFWLDKILYEIVDNLILKFKNEEEKRKLRIIKNLQYLYWEECNVNKTEIKLMESDLKLELKATENSEIYIFLLEIYTQLGDNKKYFQTFVKALGKCDNKCEWEIGFDDFKDSELDYVVNYICSKVKIYSFNKKTYQELINCIIEELFKREKYSEIIKLGDNIDLKYIDYLEFGFELAYSYRTINRNEESKKIYEKYLTRKPNSAASMNNLGTIYENEGKFEEALNLYKQAENISHNEIHTNNIKRTEKFIEDNNKRQELFIKGVELFEKENIWLKNELMLFYSECDEKYNVICPYRNLPNLLKCNEKKAQELLNLFIEKNYIFKNKKHNYETSSSVYGINQLIYERIKELEKENMIMSAFIDKFNNFTIDNLKKLDYLEIQDKLSNIQDTRIKYIFIRDYNELIYNYLSEQSKAVILLSGSIMELLLLHTLESNNISKYKVGNSAKNKKIEEMDISEMLEVCEKEKLLHKTPERFIQGMKNFRNFVHPGKEIRESLLEIDKQTVDLSIAMVRWLILSLELG